jgi:hypothetical protein
MTLLTEMMHVILFVKLCLNDIIEPLTGESNLFRVDSNPISAQRLQIIKSLITILYH